MVATLAAGTSAGYYTAATSYYLGSPEPPGRWMRVGFAAGFAVGFAVGDIVDPADFERLHAGLGRDGKPLLNNNGGHTADRVSGFDVCFSSSKTTSVLYAMADEALRKRLEEALLRAASDALAFLEREAAFCRSGKGGRVKERTRLTAAAFFHSEARPERHRDGQVFADMATHVHAVTIAIGEKSDGRFGALDGRALFAWKAAAGAVFHLQHARYLQELGFAITQVGRNGTFEVDGVDRDLCDYFSSRRQVIERELARSGLVSAEAPALAAGITRATRGAKLEGASGAARFQHWRERAKALGSEPEQVVSACLGIGAERARVAAREDREADIRTRVEAGLASLTAHDSTFELRRLKAAVSAALVGTGADLARADQEVADLFARGALVTLDRDAWGHAVLTTPEMLTVEQEVVAMARRLGVDRREAPKPGLVARLVENTNLNAEQAAAVTAATSGRGITVIEGAPGSGKSTTLAPIKAAWEAAGYRVLGAATAWRVAHQLRDDLGIEARAIDDWLARDAHGHPFLDARTVLIIDEAGLMSSRQMHALLSAVARATPDSGRGEGSEPRLILCGDRKQLAPVGPSSGLKLVASAVAVQSVETIQRQRDAWAREAILGFGRGEADAGLAAFRKRGLLDEAEGPAAAVRRLVDLWDAMRQTHPEGDHLLIARTNGDVRALSAEVRHRLRRGGLLSEDRVTLAAVTPSGHAVPLPVAVGERVRFLTRLRLSDGEVFNGTEATVEAVTEQNGTVRLTVDTGARRLTFAPAELADAQGRVRLAHAYASTIHGAQGRTVDAAFVLLTPEMDRHDIYVAASRARGDTHLVVDSAGITARMRAELPLSHPTPAPPAQADRLAYLARQLGRAGTKLSALDVLLAAQDKAARMPSPPRDRASPRRRRDLGLDL